MEYKVFSTNGKEVKTIQLNDYVFNCVVSDGSIYYAVNNELLIVVLVQQALRPVLRSITAMLSLTSRRNW